MWFGHITKHNTLAKTILHGTVEGKKERGRQKKSWLGNVKEWTTQPLQHLLPATQDREGWKKIAAESALTSPPPSPHVLLAWRNCDNFSKLLGHGTEMIMMMNPHHSWPSPLLTLFESTGADRDEGYAPSFCQKDTRNHQNSSWASKGLEFCQSQKVKRKNHLYVFTQGRTVR